MSIKSAGTLLLVLCMAGAGLAGGSDINPGTKMSPFESAKVMVAHHLLELSGGKELSRLIRTNEIKGDDYWKIFFQARQKYNLYLLIRSDLLASINSIPLMGGASASPEQFVQAILGSLRPLPLVSLHELSPGEQKNVLEFAQGPLRRFVIQLEKNPSDSSSAAVELTLEAGRTFHSAAITEGFNRLTELSQNFHLDQKEIELLEAKDRLNEMLHLYGLHMVIDGRKLSAEGVLSLSCYMVSDEFSYSILKKPFVMYQAWPLVERERNRSLGHAEMEGGFLFLFGNRVDEEVARWQNFLAAKASSPVGVRGALTPEAMKKVDARIRAIVGLSHSKADEPKWLRARLIDTIGHHEGFHRYIRDVIDAAVKTGKLNVDDEAAWHEKGAYLYQLESSDPSFTVLDLTMVLATALDSDSLVSDNRRGASLALAALQKALPRIHFWTDSGDPDPEGLLPFINLPPSEIKAAAAQARWDFEMQL